MNSIKSMMSWAMGGHESTEDDIKAINIKQSTFIVKAEGWLHKKGDVAKSWKRRYFLFVQPRYVWMSAVAVIVNSVLLWFVMCAQDAVLF